MNLVTNSIMDTEMTDEQINLRLQVIDRYSDYIFEQQGKVQEQIHAMYARIADLEKQSENMSETLEELQYEKDYAEAHGYEL